MKKIIFLFSIFFLISSLLYSQENSQHYKIQIVDSKHSEPLPFATILKNRNPHKGVIANLQAWADLNLQAKDSCIQISYVGYKTRIIHKSDISSIIKLESIEVSIKEVVVFARENPAHRIIKQTVANKKINSPDYIPEYACEVYNKHIYDYIIKEDQLKDTSLQKLVTFSKKQHVLIMESVTDRFYKSPDKTFEKIKKVKVAGFKDPSFAPLSSEMQAFHFYNPLINILDIEYLNPISKGSHRKYFFLIEDTIYSQNDSIFIISFKPKKNANFEGLKGFLHINTNKYAIENVAASPAEKKLMGVHIQQKYKFESGYWFPSELISELKWDNVYFPGVGMHFKAESYISKFRTNIPEDSIKYTEEVLVFDKLASKNVDLEMKNYRTFDLNLKEQRSYTFMDSIGEELKLDYWFNVMEKFAEGKIPLKKFYIPLSTLYTHNDFEGTRLGLGLYTDDRLIRWLELGGWGAYGTRDGEWKYGGDLNLFFDKKHETTLSFAYKYDAVFPGNQNFERNKNYMEAYLITDADYSTQQMVSFKTRIKYLQLKFNFLNDKRDPQYNYSFLLDNNWVDKFELSEFGVQFRFAYKEKYMWQFNQKIAFETSWPVLTVGFKKGLKDFYGGEIEYDKLWAQIDYSYHFPRLGKSTFRIEAGTIWGDVPYSFLFAGPGGWVSSWPFYFENRFNTMAPNAFANNEIANLFFSHDFGTRLISTSKWKPKIGITQAIGFGRLRNINVHQGITLTDMSKGYYESGLMVKDIVRVSYKNLFYLGFGGGAFYNYGAYSSSTIENNFKFKVMLSLSF